MPSFELKPMGSTNRKFAKVSDIMMRGHTAMSEAMPKVEDLIWTANRSPVPPPFAGRIPEDVWAQTFDAVQSRVAGDIDLAKDLFAGLPGGLPGGLSGVCCLPCQVFQMFGGMDQYQANAIKGEQAWLALVQSEQSTYAAYGIGVTIVAETTHTMDQYHKCNVGLRFDAADVVVAPTELKPAVVVEAAVVGTAAPVPQPMEEGLASQLAKLAELNQQGMLSDSEYATAKAKLL